MERHPRWSRRVLARGQAIVAPSDYLARVCRQLGFPVSNIPNVLDLEQYPFRLRRMVQPHLLWMRTFHPIYNPLLALEVVEQLHHHYPDVVLTMAGQDKGRKSLERHHVA